MRCRGLLLGLLYLAACRSTSSGDAPPPLAPHTGAVVSEQRLATQVGLAILDRGGNAADAAVATALALAVVYPEAGNLGGGGFAVWTSAGGDAATFDFREVSPAGYEARLYLDEEGRVVPTRSLETPLAVGVPGSPAGLFALYREFGSHRLSFEELCRPAIRLAEEGFEVDRHLADGLREESARHRLEKDPAARELFYPGGEPLAVGDRLVQPDLARTLRRLAKGGPPAFYTGPIAERILATLEAADRREGNLTRGGAMTAQDLSGYRVRSREPLRGWFRGHEVISMGPPSSGGTALLEVLEILDGFPLDAERRGRAGGQSATDPSPVREGVLSPRLLHWWIEALRIAFADRAEHLGDPDHVEVPLGRLLGENYIGRRRMEIGERAQPDIAPMAEMPAAESSQTTHLSVLDRDGNAVSLTTTLNASFGSGILVQGAGFLLNNELDDFSILAGTPNLYGLVGSAANQLAPRKRPLSSMTPTVVRDDRGRVVLVIGAPGGPRIISAVTQVILRVLVLGQSLQDAVAAPRFHQQWRPPETRVEPGFDEALLETLVERHGHILIPVPNSSFFASIQAIAVDEEGNVSVASDPRRDGVGGLQGQPLPVAESGR